MFLLNGKNVQQCNHATSSVAMEKDRSLRYFQNDINVLVEACNKISKWLKNNNESQQKVHSSTTLARDYDSNTSIKIREHSSSVVKKAYEKLDEIMHTEDPTLPSISLLLNQKTDVTEGIG